MSVFQKGTHEKHGGRELLLRVIKAKSGRAEGPFPFLAWGVSCCVQSHSMDMPCRVYGRYAAVPRPQMTGVVSSGVVQNRWCDFSRSVILACCCKQSQ